MSGRGLLWNGRPLESLSREELIAIIEILAEEQMPEPDEEAERISILARIAQLP